MIYTDTSLLLALPYYIISLVIMTPSLLLFYLVNEASTIRDSSSELKNGILNSGFDIKSILNADNEDKLKSVRRISDIALCLNNLTQLKDLSLDAKDGIFSAIKLFTPWTIPLLFSTVAAYYLQIFTIIITVLVIVF